MVDPSQLSDEDLDTLMNEPIGLTELIGDYYNDLSDAVDTASAVFDQNCRTYGYEDKGVYLAIIQQQTAAIHAAIHAFIANMAMVNELLNERITDAAPPAAPPADPDQ